MTKDHLVRINRMRRECAALDELHEETRVLFESITGNARRANADAKTRKVPKRVRRRR